MKYVVYPALDSGEYGDGVADDADDADNHLAVNNGRSVTQTCHLPYSNLIASCVRIPDDSDDGHEKKDVDDHHHGIDDHEKRFEDGDYLLAVLSSNIPPVWLPP